MSRARQHNLPLLDGEVRAQSNRTACLFAFSEFVAAFSPEEWEYRDGLLDRDLAQARFSTTAPFLPSSLLSHGRIPITGTHSLGMSDAALLSLYDHYLPFRLYADHQFGMSIPELAALSDKPSHWVEERIEAIRLCLQRQVSFETAAHS